jgi:hypothetical protein
MLDREFRDPHAVGKEHGASYEEDCAGALSSRRGEGAIKFAGTLRRYKLKLQPQPWSGNFRVSE